MSLSPCGLSLNVPSCAFDGALNGPGGHSGAVPAAAESVRSLYVKPFPQQAMCQFAGLIDTVLASILHGNTGRGGPYDVDVISGLSEPHGPDGTVAVGGSFGTEISQSGSAGHVRQAGRTAFGGARIDLALVPDLCPAALWHRPGAGRQPAIGRHGRGGLRDAVRLAFAFQKPGRPRAAAGAPGRTDVRTFCDAAARHREDAFARPRRLHHRLVQPARHSPLRGPL